MYKSNKKPFSLDKHIRMSYNACAMNSIHHKILQLNEKALCRNMPKMYAFIAGEGLLFILEVNNG